MGNCFPTYKQHLDRLMHMPYTERFRPIKWDRGINGWWQDAQRCLGSWLLLISVGFKQPLHLCGSGSIWLRKGILLASDSLFFPPLDWHYYPEKHELLWLQETGMSWGLSSKTTQVWFPRGWHPVCSISHHCSNTPSHLHDLPCPQFHGHFTVPAPVLPLPSHPLGLFVCARDGIVWVMVELSASASTIKSPWFSPYFSDLSILETSEPLFGGISHAGDLWCDWQQGCCGACWTACLWEELSQQGLLGPSPFGR